jgi:hypothetical protein
MRPTKRSVCNIHLTQRTSSNVTFIYSKQDFIILITLDEILPISSTSNKPLKLLFIGWVYSLHYEYTIKLFSAVSDIQTVVKGKQAISS